MKEGFVLCTVGARFERCIGKDYCGYLHGRVATPMNPEIRVPDGEMLSMAAWEAEEASWAEEFSRDVNPGYLAEVDYRHYEVIDNPRNDCFIYAVVIKTDMSKYARLKKDGWEWAKVGPAHLRWDPSRKEMVREGQTVYMRKKFDNYDYCQKELKKLLEV